MGKNNQSQATLNPMGQEPVGRLLLKMGIPMIISMVLQAVYNIVDSAFVSNMRENGEQAFNALTLAFPVQMLMVAIGIGTGVGMNALLSKSLGQGDLKKASKTAGNAVFLGFLIYILCVLFGIFGVKGYLQTQTSNPLILDMAESYLRICCCASFGVVYFAVFEKMLQATGRSLYSTIAQIAGAVVNIILDPIMIYGLCGVPEMGIDGAAWATVIGQVVSAVVGLIFHLRMNREIKISKDTINPSGKIIKEIYAIGVPAIIAQALMSVMTYSLNIILGKIDESVVTAYGLYYKIQQFVLFAAFGLRDAITPVISFNHGMQSKKRVKEGIRCGMKYTLIIMAFGLIVIEIFAVPFSHIFGLSGQTQTLCISAMRIISLSFLFAGANVAFQGVFQALDGGLESLVISVFRQILFVLPVAAGFVSYVGHDMDKVWLVWLTFIIAEGISVATACAFMARINKKIVNCLER